MNFRHSMDEGPLAPPQVALPIIVIWHEPPNSRFFFEDDLGESKSYEPLRELQRNLQNIEGVHEARIYRHYVALKWYNGTTAEEIEERVLRVLHRHFRWPAEPEKIDIMSGEGLRSRDHFYHGHDSKWVLGQERCL